MGQALVWVKIESIPMEFWSVNEIKAIGDRIGNTIVFDGNFLHGGMRSPTRVLVQVDTTKVLFESIELIMGSQHYIQYLDYVHVPFWCAHFHIYGFIVVDCPLGFLKKI